MNVQALQSAVTEATSKTSPGLLQVIIADSLVLVYLAAPVRAFVQAALAIVAAAPVIKPLADVVHAHSTAELGHSRVELRVAQAEAVRGHLAVDPGTKLSGASEGEPARRVRVVLALAVAALLRLTRAVQVAVALHRSKVTVAPLALENLARASGAAHVLARVALVPIVALAVGPRRVRG